MDYLAASMGTQLKALDGGALSSVELTQAYLARMQEYQALGAYLHVDEAYALHQAKAADQRRAQGETGTLLGIPLAIKDNISVRGLRNTCASKMLARYMPQFDAHVIDKLKAAGAVILGKTNMDEFAMGSSTENSAFYPARNPWAVDCIPGGSSGGSAVAVAADLCAAALGSDTGGSIRQPAAMCGLVGLKPTYGRVSRRGLVAFASSLDQIGPMTRTVDDAARLFAVISGGDDGDSTALQTGPWAYDSDPSSRRTDLKGLRIGIDRGHFSEGLAPAVSEGVWQVAHELERQGAELVDITLPLQKEALSIYYLIATAEASSNLARFDGVGYGYRSPSAEGMDLDQLYAKSRGEGFGKEVKRRIILGTYALSSGYFDAYYARAQALRGQMIEAMQTLFQSVDILLSPTAPTTAFKLGEKLADPMAMYLNDIYTIPANLARLPALSMPCGLDENHLPIGVHFTAGAGQESRLFEVARAWEGAMEPWPRARLAGFDALEACP